MRLCFWDKLPFSLAWLWVCSSWADARRSGLPTAELKNIDADMIIVAQWLLLSDEYQGRRITISTTNVKHLLPFCDAMVWREIRFS